MRDDERRNVIERQRHRHIDNCNDTGKYAVIHHAMLRQVWTPNIRHSVNTEYENDTRPCGRLERETTESKNIYISQTNLRCRAKRSCVSCIVPPVNDCLAYTGWYDSARWIPMSSTGSWKAHYAELCQCCCCCWLHFFIFSRRPSHRPFRHPWKSFTNDLPNLLWAIRALFFLWFAAGCIHFVVHCVISSCCIHHTILLRTFYAFQLIWLVDFEHDEPTLCSSSFCFCFLRRTSTWKILSFHFISLLVGLTCGSFGW